MVPDLVYVVPNDVTLSTDMVSNNMVPDVVSNKMVTGNGKAGIVRPRVRSLNPKP